MRPPRIVPRVEACSRPRRRRRRRSIVRPPVLACGALAWQSHSQYLSSSVARARAATPQRDPRLSHARNGACAHWHSRKDGGGCEGGWVPVRTQDTPARPDPRSRAERKKQHEQCAAQKPPSHQTSDGTRNRRLAARFDSRAKRKRRWHRDARRLASGPSSTGTDYI